MRFIVKQVFAFSELDTDAQERAVSNVRELLNGSWWDSADTEDIGDVILWVLAEAFHSPGWDTYGSGDFPGIDGCQLDGWDLERGQSIELRGTLTPDTAPALPWHDGMVGLTFDRTYRLGAVQWDSDADLFDDEMGEAERAMDTAVAAAFALALRAGEDEMGHKTSEESALDWCENNDHQEYDASGDLTSY
jgi:hypothetical protein